MLKSGLVSLISLSDPAFPKAKRRETSDYFVQAGEYLGRGFSQAVADHQNLKRERQLELFEERGDS